MRIIILILVAIMLVVSAAWLHAQPADELFIWTIRNDAAETISGILASICAFAGMMLMVNINGEK